MARTGAYAPILAAFLAAMPAVPALAGLEICNDTATVQSVAIGYKGQSDWTSEGWWNVAAGSCKTVITGALTRRYYYYYAENENGSFQGQNYMFCTDRAAFTIVGDTECEARGFSQANFREVDTGETATEFTLTLVDEGTGELPDARPSDSGDGVQDVGLAPPVEMPVELPAGALQSDLRPGQFGEPFQVAALFQGCELENELAFCSFYSEGLKLRAFYSGPTPEDLMFTLEAMAVNTPVMLIGDRVERAGRQHAVVVRAVAARPEGDALGQTRAAMQGDWVSDDDRRSEITIRGSEIYVRYAGEFKAARVLELADTCAGNRGAGPVMIQTAADSARPKCYRIVKADGSQLALDPVDGGAGLRFRRPR